METLAYLHLAQEHESPEVKEVTLDANKVAGKAALGALGIAAATIGAFGAADQASAYGYGNDCYYSSCGGYDYYSYDYSYYSGCGYYDSGCSSYSYDYGYYPSDYYSYGYDCGYYSSCGGGYYDYYSYDYSYGYDCGYHSSCGGYTGVSPHGYSAYDIQIALNHAGFHVAVDGVYGHQTASAIAAFQAHCGLLVDGVVGPQTWSALISYL